MADVDHPKTHVEDDKDAKLPRTQPESPKHEGIDPLSEGDTMYPAEETKADSEALPEEKAPETVVGEPLTPTETPDETETPTKSKSQERREQASK